MRRTSSPRLGLNTPLITRTLSAVAITVVTLATASTAHAFGISPPFGTQRDPSPAPTATPATSATPTPTATPKPTPSATPRPNSGSFTALWEGHNADAKNWTAYAQDSIGMYGLDMIKGSSDVTSFCPQYDHLGTTDRINFWVQLLAAMTKYESGFNPASRMVETTMSTDPVTGKQTASEGLLQLSYSDGKNYKAVLPAGVCAFDYSTDKQYAVTDLRRTILDPKTNLTCAIGILNRQIARKGAIAISSGAYWAVIKTDRSSNKLSQIRAITKALTFCN